MIFRILKLWFFMKLIRLGFRLIGPLLLLLIVLIWWAWPSSHISAPQPIVPQPEVTAQQPVEVPALDWQAIPLTAEPLKPKLVLTYADFYWDSFQWMMEYGEMEQPQLFGSAKMGVVVQIGAPFTLKEQNRLCRSFSEKLILAGEANTEQGMACQRGPKDWCQRMEGTDYFQCRQGQLTGMNALKQDWNRMGNKLKRALPKF